jgi:hypothetical protein
MPTTDTKARTVDLVLAMYAKDPTMSALAIAEALHIPRGRVLHARYRLVQRGDLIRTVTTHGSVKLYSFTPATASVG